MAGVNITVLYCIIATFRSQLLCMWGEIATDRPDRPTGPDREHIYVTLGVTLHRLGGQPAELGSENVGIDVTK